MSKKKLYLSRALRAADWYVNHQTLEKEPVNDANHGRFFYNYHVPSKTKCPGIGWSCARGVMVLLSAYEVTKNKKYLESAIHAGEYMKHLQVLDKRKSYFGIFREETPHSKYGFPRDATEVADGLAFLARTTGDREYRYRLELFWNFYARECIRKVKNYPGPWPWGSIFFNGKKVFKDAEFQGGAAAILYRYYKLTRDRKWLRLALTITDTLIKAFYSEKKKTLVSRATTGHHGNKGEAIENDDGCGVALVCAYLATKKQKYLEVATNYADYQCDHIDDITRFSAPGIQAISLMDMYKLTRKKKYRDGAEQRAKIFMKYQVLKSKDKNALYGFRGEDEHPKWYYKGAKRTDFVVQRTTAYSAIALFKLAGRIGPYYSGFGW
ncbi:beta-L-arabinofuranosidase domain-containing protein [Planctomycetota bacterium]